MPRHFTGANALGGHDVVRDLAIQGITQTQQLCQARTRVGGLQQGAVLVTRRALQRALDRSFEIDHGASLMQMATITRTHDGPAACGQHNMAPLCEHINDMLFALTKPVFTFNIEDPWNVGTSTRLDFMIRVEKLPMQQLGELPSNGGLARAHGPDQINVVNACRQHLTSQQPARVVA